MFLGAVGIRAADPPVTVQVKWDRVTRELKTKPNLLLGAAPMLSRRAPLHDAIFQRVKDLGLDDLRYATGGPYPHYGVVEREAPTATTTSWDFSTIDPVTEDVLKATAGHPLVMNFCNIPEWMFKRTEPIRYPADPNERFWKYTERGELRDPSCKEAADYFARIVSWYVNGGFKDELGQWHESGHHYKIDYWEVLNEPNLEREFSAETYTKIYDAVVEAIHKVSPQTKFVGISHSYPAGAPEFFRYFLDPKNHKPGIPLDMISYHFYAVPNADEPPEAHQYTFFNQADRFLEITGYIETLRKMLSPRTGTMVNEIGTMLPDDWLQSKPGYVFKPIRPEYWNLSAAVYAYVFAGLARQGIDDASASGVPTAPGMWPSISILHWDTAEPNARYHVLKLIRDSFRPGDKLVETSTDGGYVTAQAFVGSSGERKLLLINRRDHEFEINLETAGAKVEVVDVSTGSNPPASSSMAGSTFKLGGFGVAVVTIAK
jgi:hypothetical protein